MGYSLFIIFINRRTFGCV